MGAEIIFKYFPQLTDYQKDQYRELYSLYSFWNSQINVISRKDFDFLYERHVLHSLGIAKVCSFVSQTEILDVGTGGGFPGIPLAIMFPEAHFHLVDAIGKKIKVTGEVAQSLKLENVKVEHQRGEKIQGTYDFVVSRAVTRMKPFFDWVSHKVSKNHYNSLDNGILYLKGGDLKEEMSELGRKYRTFNLSEYFDEEFFETKKVIYIPF